MDEPEDVNPQFAPVSAFDVMQEDLGNCPDAANDDTSDEESGNKDFMNVCPDYGRTSMWTLKRKSLAVKVVVRRNMSWMRRRVIKLS